MRTSLHRPPSQKRLSQKHLFTPARRLAAVALVATLGLAGCGGTAEESASDTPSETPSATETESAAPTETPSEEPTEEPTKEAPEVQSLDIEVKGDTITPNAAEISLKVGEPLSMSFTSDRTGELHVHSKPEQYVDFGAGTSTKEITVETPGTVEVEEHDSGAVVAVIEVR